MVRAYLWAVSGELLTTPSAIPPSLASELRSSESDERPSSFDYEFYRGQSPIDLSQATSLGPTLETKSISAPETLIP